MFERIRKIGLWAKSTSQRGARAIAHDRQNLHPANNKELIQAMLTVARKAASKMRIFNMDYEDLRQEAITAIWVNLGLITTAKDPEALAYTIARQHLLKHYRHADVRIGQVPVSPDRLEAVAEKNFVASSGQRMSEAAHGPAEGNYEGDGWSRRVAHASHFWTAYYAEQAINTLHDALGMLPARDQQILKLYYGFNSAHEGLTLDEIARLVDGGIATAYVKELKSAALDKLRRHLTASGYNL